MQGWIDSVPEVLFATTDTSLQLLLTSPASFFFSLNLIIIVGSQTIILTIVQKGVNTVKQKKKITSSPRSSSLSCHPQESPAGPEAVPVAELAVGAIADELAGVVDQESGRSRTTSTCQAASMSILKS